MSKRSHTDAMLRRHMRLQDEVAEQFRNERLYDKWRAVWPGIEKQMPGLVARAQETKDSTE